MAAARVDYCCAAADLQPADVLDVAASARRDRAATGAARHVAARLLPHPWRTPLRHDDVGRKHRAGVARTGLSLRSSATCGAGAAGVSAGCTAGADATAICSAGVLRGTLRAGGVSRWTAWLARSSCFAIRSSEQVLLSSRSKRSAVEIRCLADNASRLQVPSTGSGHALRIAQDDTERINQSFLSPSCTGGRVAASCGGLRPCMCLRS